MTRSTNARIAGIAYLFYIAVAFPSMLLSDRAARGDGIAAQLASFAQHATDVRVAAVLTPWLFLRLILAVTLYAITRDLPLQLTRVLTGPVTQLMWIPVAVFELVVAVWFIIKGVATPEAR